MFSRQTLKVRQLEVFRAAEASSVVIRITIRGDEVHSLCVVLLAS